MNAMEIKPSIRFFIFLSVCFLVTPALASKAPVIHLSFNDKIQDEGPYHFPTKVHGDEVRLGHGKSELAVFIGGTHDWIDVEVDDRIDFSKGGTIEFWFQRDDWENSYKGGSGWQTLAHIDGLTVNVTAPGCPLHEPWAVQGTVARFEYDRKEPEATARVSLVSSPGVIAPHRWYHVLLKYSAEDQSASLYIDGQLIQIVPQSPVPMGKRVNPLRLGTWFKNNQAFRGYIDELKIYDFAYTPEIPW